MPNNPYTGRTMDPIPQVFGGERNTPHAVFDQSRRESGWTPENPTGTAVAAHRPNDLALACPACRAEGNPGVRMFSREGVGYYGICGKHSWKDFDQLMALNPDKLPFRGHKTIQPNYRKVEVEVPQPIADAFIQKFGDRGAATLSAVMEVLSGQRSMIIGEDDLKSIEDRLGETISNPRYLAGKIFSLKSEVVAEKATVERLRQNLQQVGAAGSVGENTIVVDLGDNLAAQLHQMVQSKDWTVETYVKEALRLAVEGNWV